MAPKTAHEGLKALHGGPMAAHGGPETSHDGPKASHDGSRPDTMAPRPHTMAPRPYTMAPRPHTMFIYCLLSHKSNQIHWIRLFFDFRQYMSKRAWASCLQDNTVGQSYNTFKIGKKTHNVKKRYT